MTSKRIVLSGAGALATIIACGGCQNPPPAPTANGVSPAVASVEPYEADRTVHPREAPPRQALEGELPTGRWCRVHFRRDAVGVAGNAPLAVTDRTHLGQIAQIEGTVDRVSDEWLVVTSGAGRTFWIPRETVLAVEFSDDTR